MIYCSNSKSKHNTMIKHTCAVDLKETQNKLQVGFSLYHSFWAATKNQRGAQHWDLIQSSLSVRKGPQGPTYSFRNVKPSCKFIFVLKFNSSWLSWLVKIIIKIFKKNECLVTVFVKKAWSRLKDKHNQRLRREEKIRVFSSEWSCSTCSSKCSIQIKKGSVCVYFVINNNVCQYVHACPIKTKPGTRVPQTPYST